MNLKRFAPLLAGILVGIFVSLIVRAQCQKPNVMAVYSSLIIYHSSDNEVNAALKPDLRVDVIATQAGETKTVAKNLVVREVRPTTNPPSVVLQTKSIEEAENVVAIAKDPKFKKDGKFQLRISKP